MALLPLICSNSPTIRLTHTHTHTHTHTQQLYSTNSGTFLFSQKGESLASETKRLMKRICCLSFSFVVTLFYTGYTKRHFWLRMCYTHNAFYFSTCVLKRVLIIVKKRNYHHHGWSSKTDHYLAGREIPSFLGMCESSSLYYQNPKSEPTVGQFESVRRSSHTIYT